MICRKDKMISSLPDFKIYPADLQGNLALRGVRWCVETLPGEVGEYYYWIF
jgi:hypothetical protein